MPCSPLCVHKNACTPGQGAEGVAKRHGRPFRLGLVSITWSSDLRETSEKRRGCASSPTLLRRVVALQACMWACKSTRGSAHMHRRVQTSMTLCTYTRPFANKHAGLHTCRARCKYTVGCAHVQ